MSFLRNVVWAGAMAGLLSAAAAAACSRIEKRRPARAIDAINHIAWGGLPPYQEGSAGRSLVTGAALQGGASLFWALVFEALFGRAARAGRMSALLGGAATAAAACLTDYRIVSRRFRPGLEASLSRPALLGVYAALAAGFALGAQIAGRTGDRRWRATPLRRALRYEGSEALASGDPHRAASFTRLRMP